MVSVVWPRWVAWLIPVAILLNMVLSVAIFVHLRALRENPPIRKLPFRNQAELEEAFVAGKIRRAEYERLKAKLS